MTMNAITTELAAEHRRDLLQQAPRTYADDHGVAITAAGLSKHHRDGTTALDAVTLAIRPGRLTAIVGPSGAGKTTLLAALAGVTPVDAGSVSLHASTDGAANPHTGFVPQDDILHGDLPLRRTLRYAASLRMSAPAAVREDAVDLAMKTLGLAALGDVPVRSLSGGQRKRASIACEILTSPTICFLDEPTSGLDPAAAGALITLLQRMAAQGSTIVFTTHSITDIERSDHVVALAPGGRVAAAGTPTEVLHGLEAPSFAELYQHLARAEQPRALRAPAAHVDPVPSARPTMRKYSNRRPSAVTQWLVLTRRAADILSRNRLTLAILVGSPTAVIAMFAVLFRRGAAAADAAAAVQVAYWLSFAGFFFGLTFGLLQVCTEVAVLRREHQSGMRIGAYLASKRRRPGDRCRHAGPVGVRGCCTSPARSRGHRATVAVRGPGRLLIGDVLDAAQRLRGRLRECRVRGRTAPRRTRGSLRCWSRASRRSRPDPSRAV